VHATEEEKMKEKKLSRRSFLRLGALTAAGAAVAACQPKTVIVEKEVEKEVTKVVKETVVVEAPPLEEVELEVWHTEDEFDAIIPNFQLEHPNVKVNFQHYPWGEYFEKLEITYAAGDPPDVHRQDDDEIPSFAQRGLLMPMEDHVLAAINKEDLSWGTIESTMIEGHLYVAISHTRAANIWYNKDMFDAAGVDYPPTTYPSDDWTWEKFVETARALTNVDEMQYGVADTSSPDMIVSIGRSNGGTVMSQDCAEFLMNDEPFVWAIQAMADLMLKEPVGAADVETQQAFGGGGELFYTGKAGMLMGSTRGGPLTTPVDFEWDYAGLPIIPGKEPSVVGWIECYGVPTMTQHPREATQFAVYLMQDKAQELFAKSKSVIPINKTAADVWVQRIPQNRQVLIEAAPYGRTLPFAVGFPKLQEIAWPMLAEVMLGQKTAQEAMDEAKPLCDAALAEAGGCLG
jgi:multiple sugar transport system substrate-binding protein